MAYSQAFHRLLSNASKPISIRPEHQRAASPYSLTISLLLYTVVKGACGYAMTQTYHQTDTDSKKRFGGKMSNFAKKYFNDDIRKLTYCMKDVYNWKIYCDLYNSFQKVDYTQLSETEDNTAGIEETSCAGGACLI